MEADSGPRKYDLSELRLDAYDTIVPLCHWLNPDGSLTDEFRGRMDTAIGLYFEGRGKTFTANGKYGPRHPDTSVTLTEAMKKHAIERGVNPADIFKDEESLDTVGNAYFVKRDVVIPNGWKSLAVVSSDYHMLRAETIFDLIFGPEYTIDYVGVATPLGSDFDTLMHELDSLGKFLETFHGVEPGDDKVIGERLFSKHPLYRPRTDDDAGLG